MEPGFSLDLDGSDILLSPLAKSTATNVSALLTTALTVNTTTTAHTNNIIHNKDNNNNLTSYTTPIKLGKNINSFFTNEIPSPLRIIKTQKTSSSTRKITKTDNNTALQLAFEDSELMVQPTSLLNADPRQALDLVHEKQADDFNKFLVNFLQHEPIDNDNDITMFPTNEDDFMLPLLSNTDLFPTSDNDRKRTRSPLITDNETLIDNSFTDSDSQSENLNLNRAQNKKSRK